MRIVAISDTHTYHNKMMHPIPDGDVIIHAGDFMSSGWHKCQYVGFLKWFNKLPHKHKIFIAGNHDRYVELYNEEFRNDVKALDNVTYLQDEECIINEIKFYGSPWQKWFYSWAFNFPNHHENPERAYEVAKNCWAKIPDDVNVLITHGQPWGINDRAPDGEYTGCKELMKRISHLTYLKLYIGGHIHCQYGLNEVCRNSYINASICNEAYAPINPPVIFDL